jgi:molecular chaperone DnaK (HSP70)
MSVGIDFGTSKSAAASTRIQGKLKHVVQLNAESKASSAPDSSELQIQRSIYSIPTAVAIKRGFNGSAGEQNPVFVVSFPDNDTQLLSDEWRKSDEGYFFVQSLKQKIGGEWKPDEKRSLSAQLKIPTDLLPRPEEMSARILDHLRSRLSAELQHPQLARFGAPVAITVPSFPTTASNNPPDDEKMLKREYRRYKAMYYAAWLAGFDHIELIEEPLAAAVYLESKFKPTDGKYTIVIDYGAWTCDIALFLKDRGRATQLIKTLSVIRADAKNGDNRVGGSHLDQLALQRIFGKQSGAEYRLEGQEIYEGTDIEPLDGVYQRAIAKMRETKEKWSNWEDSEEAYNKDPDNSVIRLPATQFKGEMTYQDWMELAQAEVSIIIAQLTQLLKDEHITDYDYVDRVLLVGGASRIPVLRKELEVKELFKPVTRHTLFTQTIKRVVQIDEPEWCVVRGAAQAAERLARDEAVFPRKSHYVYHLQVNADDGTSITTKELSSFQLPHRGKLIVICPQETQYLKIVLSIGFVVNVEYLYQVEVFTLKKHNAFRYGQEVILDYRVNYAGLFTLESRDSFTLHSDLKPYSDLNYDTLRHRRKQYGLHDLD